MIENKNVREWLLNFRQEGDAQRKSQVRLEGVEWDLGPEANIWFKYMKI